MKIVNGFEFDSQIKYGPNLVGSYSQNVIKNEPMLFNCDTQFAYSNGGPITKEFLDKLYYTNWNDTGNWVIDSRVHMAVVEGCYLCIPGFHHDDVPRTRSDGQPDYHSPAYKAEHCCCVVGADIAPTRFATGKAFFQDVPIGKKYYKEWHTLVNNYIKDGTLLSRSIEDRKLTFFDWETWHEGTPAVKTGWRFFIRASRYTHRKVTNEIRKQVQIYLPNPMEGW